MKILSRKRIHLPLSCVCITWETHGYKVYIFLCAQANPSLKVASPASNCIIVFNVKTNALLGRKLISSMLRIRRVISCFTRYHNAFSWYQTSVELESDWGCNVKGNFDFVTKFKTVTMPFICQANDLTIGRFVQWKSKWQSVELLVKAAFFSRHHLSQSFISAAHLAIGWLALHKHRTILWVLGAMNRLYSRTMNKHKAREKS